MQLIRFIVVCTHVLAGSIWLGAMFYGLLVIQPRTRSYFREPEEFEDFARTLAAGARWKVLAGCLMLAATGIGLLALSPADVKSSAWWKCLATKTGLFAFAVGLFCHVSWKLWPERLLAGRAELPALQGRFRVIGLALLILVGLCMTLGVLGRFV